MMIIRMNNPNVLGAINKLVITKGPCEKNLGDHIDNEYKKGNDDIELPVHATATVK